MGHIELSFEEKVRADLLNAVPGEFSSADAQEILRIADLRWNTFLQQTPDAAVAWQETIHDFVSTSYWGFRPVTVSKRKNASGINLGIQYILIVFFLFTFGITGLVWFGQIYTNEGDPIALAAFFTVLISILTGIGWFTWRNRH